MAVSKNKPKNNYKGDKTKVSGYDVCQTPPHAIEPIIEILKYFVHSTPGDAIIWESASGPEELLVNALRNEHFEVLATDLLIGYNFFEYSPRFIYPSQAIVQVTNPPWSIKYDWIEESFRKGFPFALLVPFETAAAGKFQTLARKYHNNPYSIDILDLQRRINFKMPNKGWSNSAAQMPTMWLMWGLPVDLEYEPIANFYSVPMRNVKYNDDNTEKSK